MRRLTTRAFLAAAAAGGTLLTMTAGVSTAGATPVPYAPIPTTSQAGYVATHNTFRYVTTTFKVPAASVKHVSYAEVVLGGSTGYPATLGVKSGGGAGSVAFNVVGPLGGMGGGTMTLAPKPGDMMTLSIFFNAKAGLDNFTATDLTQKVSQTLVLPPTPHQAYTAAEVAAVLIGKAVTPEYAVKLWGFTGSHVTTLAGTRGTMNGPWLTRKIIDVAADGHVVMAPSGLWDQGQSFGVWLKAAR